MTDKEFAPHQEALELKQLGFNEPCLASYYHAGRRLDICEYINHGEYTILAQTYSQAFRWFRESHNLFHEILVDRTMEPKFAYIIHEYEAKESSEGFLDETRSQYLYRKHEEAELECLRDLIKILKGKNNTE